MFPVMHGNFLQRKTSRWSSMVPIIVVSGRMVQLNPRILQICHIIQLHTRVPFYIYHLTWPPLSHLHEEKLRNREAIDVDANNEQ